MGKKGIFFRGKFWLRENEEVPLLTKFSGRRFFTTWNFKFQEEIKVEVYFSTVFQSVGKWPLNIFKLAKVALRFKWNSFMVPEAQSIDNQGMSFLKYFIASYQYLNRFINNFLTEIDGFYVRKYNLEILFWFINKTGRQNKRGKIKCLKKLPIFYEL